MKQELSSLELKYLVEEFKEIVNGRFDKIYLKEKNFLFTVYAPSKGKKLLRVNLEGQIYFTEYKESFLGPMHGFCQFLRKKLGGARIDSVYQHAFERIIIFNCSTKESNYNLIIELFSNGNIILCNQDMKIISAFDNQRWKDRTIRGGVIYEFPPQQINTSELDKKDFIEVIDSSEKDSIVKTLAIDMSLGGLYAEETCLLAGVDKIKKFLSLKEKNLLYNSMINLLSLNPNPCLVVEKKEALPFELEIYKDYEKKYFKTFSEAIDFLLSAKLLTDSNSAGEKEKNVVLKRIRKILNQQEETIKGLEISSAENQKKGEFIYENYNVIKKVLEDLNIVRKKHSWDEIKEKLKGHKLIKDVDENEGKLILEIK